MMCNTGVLCAYIECLYLANNAYKKYCLLTEWLILYIAQKGGITTFWVYDDGVYPGGSRLSEFRKIPVEIFRKSVTFEISATFSVTFYKKFNNQLQKGDFWNLNNIFQWLFEKYGVWKSKKPNYRPISCQNVL